MRRLLTLATLLVATLGGAQTTVPWSKTPEAGLGPLLLHSQSPLAVFRLSPTPHGPETLRAGQWQITSLVEWNNYFDISPGRYIIDAEALRLVMRAAYGVTDRLELSVHTPVSYRGGGVMDSFINHFHKTFGIVNEDRARAPENRYLIRLQGRNGQVYELTGRDAGWGIEDTVVTARCQLLAGVGGTPALAGELLVKVPTGRESSLYSSSGFDVGVGLTAGKSLGRFNLYGHAVAMRYAATDFAGVRLRRHQWSLMGALAYRATPRTSYILQGLATSGGARNFGDFSKNSYEVSLGFKHLVHQHWLLEMALLENLFIFNNSPDFGVHAGLTWRSPL